MTPTIVEEQEHDLDDDTSPDAADEDDNVQGAGALPHTVSENIQKSSILVETEINIFLKFFRMELNGLPVL